MTKASCATLLALGMIGLAACEPASREASVSPPEETEGIPPGETLTDLVREDLADILRDGDAYSRARRLGALLPTLGPELVPVVKETLGNARLDYRATELDLLLRYWATYEPREATLWAVGSAPTDYRAAAVFSALRVWAEADPLAAAEATWMWTVEAGGLDGIVPEALVRGWYAANDDAGLRRWMAERPPGIPQQRFIAAYARLLFEDKGHDELMRWAEALPEDDRGYKLAVFSRVTTLLAFIDVEGALRWCERHCDGPHGGNMRSAIARQWADHDGAAALAWLSTVRPGYERDLAVRLTFLRWTRADVQGALAWMAAQTQAGEAEPWLRPAYGPYARALAPEAPAEAIRVAERIEDERERGALLVAIARLWRQSDEAAAEAWLLQSPLPEGEREQARVPLPKGVGF